MTTSTCRRSRTCSQILKPGSERPLIAKGTVRFVGEPVVAVVAVDRHTAVDAAAMVYVDIEPLAAVVDLDDALTDDDAGAPGARHQHLRDVHLRAPGRLHGLRGRARSAGGEPADQRLRRSNRAAGSPTGSRIPTVTGWCTIRRVKALTRPATSSPSCTTCRPTQVRVVVPDVGGGFGVKSRTIGEELTLGWLSKQVGTPVRYTETRTEAMQAMPQGRGQRIDVKIGGTRDGRVTAYQLDVVQDAGAYPLMGAYLPIMTQRMTPGVYDIANCGFRGVSVATTRCRSLRIAVPVGPRRRWPSSGRWTYYAAEIGMDPADVRRRNFIPKFMEPYTTGIGTVYDVGDYGEAMRRVLAAADYPALRQAQAAQRAAGTSVLTGIGIAVYVEITAGGAPSEYGAVHLLADGRMRVLTGATPYGQGHVTTWKMIIADRLGVPMDDVDVVHGDTDEVPSGGLTVGSRSVQVAGSSLVIAAGKLAEAARERAANLLEAAVEDVVLDAERGTFHVAGSSMPAVGWADVAAAEGEPLVGLSDFKAAQPTYPVRRPRRRGRCRHRDRQGDVAAGHRGRRCRNPAQPVDRRWSDPRRHRSGRCPGAVGVDAVRRGRQPGHVELRRLPRHLRCRAAEFRARAHGDADVGESAWRQRRGRVRHHRLDPCRAQCGHRCAGAVRRAAPRRPGHAAACLGRHRAGSTLDFSRSTTRGSHVVHRFEH